MNRKKYSLITLSLMIVSSNVFAQTDSSDKKKSYFKANLNYLSNAVYFGRKDSAAVPYLRSSLGYYDKSGFYISTGAAMLVSPNETKRIDLINVDAGYNFSLNKLDVGLNASKFFYSNASFAVGSELKGMAGVNAGYYIGSISVNGGAEALFTSNIDYSANFGLSHPFESGEENKKLTINPTVQLNAGTQYFNEAYYEFRKFSFTTSNSGSGGSSKGKGRGHSNTGNTGSTSTSVKSVTFYDKNRFTILDYELSLPVNYDAKSWGAYLLPVIAIPTNPANFAIDNVIQKEKLSTAFFAEIGAYIKF